MRNVTRKSLTLGAFLATTALASPALAQSSPIPPPPQFQTIDANGVDLSSGSLVYGGPTISIGSKGAGLSYAALGNTLRGAISSSGSTFTVAIGNSAENFTQSGTSYLPAVPTGSTLTQISGGWVYTMRDGTVANFENTPIQGSAIPYADNQGLITSIVKPNGETITYAYHTDSFTYCVSGTCYPVNGLRLQSITSSLGYLLTVGYGSDTYSYSTAAQWAQIGGVMLTNLAAGGASQGITISGTGTGFNYNTAAGTTTVTQGAAGITGIELPGHTSNDISIVYNANNLIQSVTNAGVTTTYAYADDTTNGVRTTTVTDALNKQWVYKFRLSDLQATSVTDPLNHTISKSYYSNGLLQYITSPEGNYTEYQYDTYGRGNVTKVISHPKSGTGTISTSASFLATCSNRKTCNQPQTTTDANGNVTTYTYDPNSGGPATITYPQPKDASGALRPQPVTNYKYTALQAYYAQGSGIAASGQPIYLLTKTWSCQTMTLNTCGETGSDATQTTIDYGPQVAGTGNNLLPHSITSSDGTGTAQPIATTTYTYTALGDVDTVDGPLAADTTKYRYYDDRMLMGVTSPDPDGAGTGQPMRATKIIYNPDGQVKQKLLGTVPTQSDADWTNNFTVKETIDVGFDSYNRPITQKLSSGALATLTQTIYDADGRVSCTTIRMNSSVYGSLPTTCTQSTGGTDQIVQVLYDDAGHPTDYKIGVGTSAAATERHLTYNPNGTIHTLTDGDGNVTTYGYDLYDRPNKTTYSDGSHEDSTPDNNGNVTNYTTRAGQAFVFQYDSLNQLVSKDAPGIANDVTYTYDNARRMKSAGNLSFNYDALGRNSDQIGPLGTVHSDWYLDGHRKDIVYPAGGTALTVNYNYLVTGEVSSITQGSNSLATYSYDSLGNLLTVGYGNGTSQNFTFDALSRLQSLNIAGLPAGDNLTVGDSTHPITYNAASQILTARHSDGANAGTFAWPNYSAVSRTQTINGLNQVTKTTSTVAPLTTAFGYDKNGNLTQSGNTYYCYDAENRLIFSAANAACTSPTATLSYDPMSRLKEIVKGTSDTQFQYDGLNMIAEYDGAGALQHRYVFGPGANNPIVQYDGTGLTASHWLYGDERGSVVASANATGAVDYTNTYDEYGNPPIASDGVTNLNSGRFQYTGQIWLPELGMYYYKARMYSPTMGRFLQTDPIGYGDGMNWYAYVHNDPANHSDPSGLGDQGTITVTFCPSSTGNVIVRTDSGVFCVKAILVDVGPLPSQLPPGLTTIMTPGSTGGIVNQPAQTKKLTRCLTNFLHSFDPSVDWSKVTLVEGGNVWNSDATTFGYDIHITSDLWNHIPGNLLFHEFGHVPQWASGRMSLGRYIGQSFVAWLDYAGEASATYGMNPASTRPPSGSIHDRIPLEQDAENFGQALAKAYQKAGAPCG